MDKPDIIATIEAEGINLIKKGRDLWGLCPFHPDQTPSFKVNPKTQRFHCFGCDASGDSIDFTMKLHHLTFKDALKRLRIEPGQRSTKDESHMLRKAKRETFEAWKRHYYWSLCAESIRLHELRLAVKNRKTPLSEEAGFLYAEEISKLPAVEHELDLLSGDLNQDVFDLLNERKGNDV
jgi:DNA primase